MSKFCKTINKEFSPERQMASNGVNPKYIYTIGGYSDYYLFSIGREENFMIKIVNRFLIQKYKYGFRRNRKINLQESY